MVYPWWHFLVAMSSSSGSISRSLCLSLVSLGHGEGTQEQSWQRMRPVELEEGSEVQSESEVQPLSQVGAGPDMSLIQNKIGKVISFYYAGILITQQHPVPGL